METHKITCSFLGHRKIDITKELVDEVKLFIKELIVNLDVTTFLFGSRSQFNDLCHSIVTELKKTYPHVTRVNYTCKSESCFLEKDKEKWDEIYSEFLGDLRPPYHDEEYEHKTKYTAGKASYVERNRAMIDDSNYCVFYYDSTYYPMDDDNAKTIILSTHKKSGTKLAYEYAEKKKKIIFNVKPMRRDLCGKSKN